MNTIACEYCKSKLWLLAYRPYNPNYPNSKKITDENSWRTTCGDCSASFFFDKELKLSRTILYTWYKDVNYQARLLYKSHKCLVFKGIKTYNWKYVCVINNIPKFTPKNIQQKLPVYLTFL